MLVENSTGAVKADDNKNKLDLLPIQAIEDVGAVLTFGARKYEPNNWRKGFVWSRLTAAALRHLFAWMKGEDNDPESGISHISHAITNLMFLLEMIKTGTGKDDRYKY